MPNASDRSRKIARKLGGASTSSNETPVASTENPNPVDEGTGNTAATRPHPSGAKALAGRDPPLSTDRRKDRPS